MITPSAAFNGDLIDGSGLMLLNSGRELLADGYWLKVKENQSKKLSLPRCGQNIHVLIHAIVCLVKWMYEQHAANV